MQPADNPRKPCKLLISVSNDVFNASARDRGERTFSDLVDRLLRGYYFDAQPDELARLEQDILLRKKSAEPLLAQIQALEAKAAALRERASLEDAERKQGAGLREYARWRLAHNPGLSFSVFDEDCRTKQIGMMLSPDVRRQIFRDEQDTIHAMKPDARQNLRDSYRGRSWDQVSA